MLSKYCGIIILIFSLQQQTRDLFAQNSRKTEVVDSIYFTIDDKVFAKSDIEHIKKNYHARTQISSQVFPPLNSVTNEDIVKVLTQNHIIKMHLKKLGHVITDDHIESEIRNTEKKLNITRDGLISFLKNQGMSFDEYFTLVGESIEFGIFTNKVITPLILVSEQEIKNRFFNQNQTKTTLSFNYFLIDFVIGKNHLKGDDTKNLPQIYKQFQEKGIIPAHLKSFSTNVLGKISEDGLGQNIKMSLKSINEGNFSKPVLIGDDYHVFFVKEKNLAESEHFQKIKMKIKNEIFYEKMKKTHSEWIEAHKSDHLIKVFN